MASTPQRRRIRAVRSESPEETIAARAAALRPFLGKTRAERLTAVRRLLRLERRAARCGVDYDAVRHAALRRLMAEPEEMEGRRVGRTGVRTAR